MTRYKWRCHYLFENTMTSNYIYNQIKSRYLFLLIIQKYNQRHVLFHYKPNRCSQILKAKYLKYEVLCLILGTLLRFQNYCENTHRLLFFVVLFFQHIMLNMCIYNI